MFSSRFSKALDWDWKIISIFLLPPLFWAGNFVVGRAIRNDLSPMTLSFGRWVIALICILPFAYRGMRQDWRWYLQHPWLILGISAAGVAAFNSLVYTGLHYTAVTNGILLNSTIPVLIVLFGAIFYQQKLNLFQTAGLLLSSFGVITIILRGELGYLTSMTFSKGDLIVFVAMICWALYTLWLRRIPADIDRIGLMAVQIIVGLIVLAPFFVHELMSYPVIHWNQSSILALGYVGIFPSVIAYLLYNLAVKLVGAVRTGLSIHLIPVFGTILSVVILGETLHFYHWVGALGIFFGILLASKTA